MEKLFILMKLLKKINQYFISHQFIYHITIIVLFLSSVLKVFDVIKKILFHFFNITKN